MSSKTPFTDLVQRAFRQGGWSIPGLVQQGERFEPAQKLSANTCYQVINHGRLPTKAVLSKLIHLLMLNSTVALNAYSAQKEYAKPRVQILIKEVGTKLSNREAKVLEGYRAAPPRVKRCIDYLTGV